jgi:hypothetical protein
MSRLQEIKEQYDDTYPQALWKEDWDYIWSLAERCEIVEEQLEKLLLHLLPESKDA